MKINKKLWSFIFGCFIAGAFVWLISVGNNAAVPQFLYPYPNFIIDYYSAVITAIITVFFTLIMMIIMKEIFSICVSEHPFWLALPSMFFVCLTFFASNLMFVSMLSAALPALTMMVLTATILRLFHVKKPKQAAM